MQEEMLNFRRNYLKSAQNRQLTKLTDQLTTMPDAKNLQITRY